ncbi:hypothetical protein [Streptomyces sp. NPDC059639]|uniref:hypothetical protein n=1 Tax=Streptomyces sp. NPDC059639 TaxID=3346891 RepID=UPI0036B419C3
MSKVELPVGVGDEVLDDGDLVVVTDIRGGVVWLRTYGGTEEWPAQDSAVLEIVRRRQEIVDNGGF